VKNIKENTIHQVKKHLHEAENVLIITHYNPDGDAIGSSLALYHFLKKTGYHPTVITPNQYPVFLKWLPDNDQILIYDEKKKAASDKIRQADLIFFLDFNAPDRVQSMESLLKESEAMKVLIDHHPNPDSFADVIISTTQVSSTSELLYEFISKLDGEDIIDHDMSECLYTGIMTDTGSFSYNSSLADTYYIVSKLIENGIDKDKIYWKVYDNYSVDRMRLLGYCLNDKLKVFPKYGAAYISISADELKKFNYKPGDSEGFVNYPLSIQGVVFSVIFIEREDHVKISFRSKGMFYANKFAEKHFNGGGHRNAAGGYSEASLKETLDKFESLLSGYKDEILKHRI
jgi:phosphoesterase RecJ-like protein